MLLQRQRERERERQRQGADQVGLGYPVLSGPVMSCPVLSYLLDSGYGEVRVR